MQLEGLGQMSQKVAKRDLQYFYKPIPYSVEEKSKLLSTAFRSHPTITHFSAICHLGRLDLTRPKLPYRYLPFQFVKFISIDPSGIKQVT